MRLSEARKTGSQDSAQLHSGHAPLKISVPSVISVVDYLSSNHASAPPTV